MKELKDLLKADKYLEAKAFILSNLDKIEECIDDVLEELADMSSLRPLCITTEEINQDLKEELVKRMGKETTDNYYRILSGFANIGNEHDIVGGIVNIGDTKIK